MKKVKLMRRKSLLACLALCLILLPLFNACEQKYNKYQADFIGVFDTSTTIIGYAKSEKEFTRYAETIQEELKRLHKLYDIYNDYDGLNNLKTINDNAGIAPVKVDADIIELLKLSKQAYHDTGGIFNITLGPVLKIWHDYRAAGIDDIGAAKLPPMEDLREASLNTDIENLIIDEEKSTAYLKEAGMSIDVGSVAKGYAAEKAVLAAKEAGMESALVSVGGNIIAVGKPLDDTRDRWGVGIQDPKKDVGDVSNVADTVFLNDKAVVTSGSYQRYYVVDGKTYSHIIDPETLMPADKYNSVTVIHESSAMADALSTAVFILPEKEAEVLLRQHGASALWIYFDGTMKATGGYSEISKAFSNYSSKDK